jgi:hypothetical protein
MNLRRFLKFKLTGAHNFYISFLSKRIYLSSAVGSNSLPGIIRSVKRASVMINGTNDSFLFFRRLDYTFFIQNLGLLFKDQNFGYFTTLELSGLGYRIKFIIEDLFRLYIGQSHYIYFYSPSDVLFYAFHNKLVLYSLYPEKLYSLMIQIMLLRPLNPYKLRGIIRPTQLITFKEGKQR